MIAQNLKKSILQEAISGRLVSQIESEGTADDLLQQIAKEHREAFLAQQAKEKAEAEANGKKFTPKKYVPLTFSVISEDEQPFEIPNSWRWLRLGAIVKSITDGVHQRPNYTKHGIPFLSVKDISSGHLDFSDTKFVSEDEYNKMSVGCKPQKGDIIVSKVGTTGIPCFVNTDEKFCLFVSVALLRMYNNINPFYLIYTINSPLVQQQVKENTKGVGNKNWVLKDISNTILPLPPLSEQRRIVSKLESLLPKIDSLSETETRLSVLESTLGDRLWKSVLQEAIAGRLTTQLESDGTADILLDQIKAAHREAFDAEQAKAKAAAEKSGKKFVPKKYTPLTFSQIPQSEIPFNIPDNWKWVRLGEIFQHSAGKQLSSSNQQGRLHKYITTSNLYWNRFILDNLKEMYYRDEELERCTAKKGDLLVCEGGDVGRSAIWNYDYDICLQNHVHRLRPFTNGYTEYIYYVIYFLKTSNQIVGKGTAIQGLSANSLKKILIPLPPLSEQERIVAKLDRLRGALGRD